jgi:hypothetical protein
MSYPGQQYSIPNYSQHHQQQHQQQPYPQHSPSPSGYHSPPPPLSPVPQFPQPQSPYYATPSRSPGHSPLPYPSTPPPRPTIAITTETSYATRDIPGSYFAPQYVPPPQPMYHGNSPIMSPVATNPTAYLDLPPPPPSRAQSFDTPAGRHEHFQYSQCNGKRKVFSHMGLTNGRHY